MCAAHNRTFLFYLNDFAVPQKVQKRQCTFKDAGEPEKMDNTISTKESGCQPLGFLKVLKEVERIVYQALKHNRNKNILTRIRPISQVYSH